MRKKPQPRRRPAHGARRRPHGRSPSPLTRFRLARGLNQSQLASVAGIPQQTISRAEWGLRMPAPSVQAHLATILGVTRQELFPRSLYPEAYPPDTTEAAS